MATILTSRPFQVNDLKSEGQSNNGRLKFKKSQGQTFTKKWAENRGVRLGLSHCPPLSPTVGHFVHVYLTSHEIVQNREARCADKWKTSSQYKVHGKSDSRFALSLCFLSIFFFVFFLIYTRLLRVSTASILYWNVRRGASLFQESSLGKSKTSDVYGQEADWKGQLIQRSKVRVDMAGNEKECVFYRRELRHKHVYRCRTHSDAIDIILYYWLLFSLQGGAQLSCMDICCIITVAYTHRVCRCINRMLVLPVLLKLEHLGCE